MHDVFSWILTFSMLMLCYIYVIFPGVMYLLTLIPIYRSEKVQKYRSIAVVIPSHNEEKVIEEKIENHLKLEYIGKYKIYVLCDSCSDRTVALAKSYEEKFPEMLEVFEVEGGLGKTNAINQLVPRLKEDVIVFTDANVMLDSSALERVNIALDQDSVGGVAGQLTYVNAELGGAAESNGLYWKYEEVIKKGEAIYGSLMGADGSIFAIKTKYYRQLPTHVLDDFSTSMGVVAQGALFKFDDSIKAYEKGAESNSEEFSRKVRISNRSYNSYLNMRKEILSKFSLVELTKFYSHKVIRWYSFLFMISTLVSSTFLALMGNAFAVFLILGQAIFYLMAIIHHIDLLKPGTKIYKLGNIIYYFVMVNLAAMIGVVKSLRGEKISTWKKAESSR